MDIEYDIKNQEEDLLTDRETLSIPFDDFESILEYLDDGSMGTLVDVYAGTKKLRLFADFFYPSELLGRTDINCLVFECLVDGYLTYYHVYIPTMPQGKRVKRNKEVTGWIDMISTKVQLAQW